MIRRKPKPKPNYANIRRLELELGFREWDADDDHAIHLELLTQLRYVNPETVAERIAERKALAERGLLQSGYAAASCEHPTGPLPYDHSSRKHLARESSTLKNFCALTLIRSAQGGVHGRSSSRL